MNKSRMKILVYPHTMEIGGSQINAIELAAAVRNRGHEVFVISRPGPLVDMVYRLDLPHLQIPDSYRPFSHRLWRHLARIVDELQIDVAHGYEMAARTCAVSRGASDATRSRCLHHHVYGGSTLPAPLPCQSSSERRIFAGPPTQPATMQ